MDGSAISQPAMQRQHLKMEQAPIVRDIVAIISETVLSKLVIRTSVIR